jgi:hypothetical protein
MVGRTDFRLTGKLETIDARHIDIRDEEMDPIIGQNAHGIIPVRCCDSDCSDQIAQTLADGAGHTFLNVCCAASSACGWRGRTDTA